MVGSFAQPLRQAAIRLPHRHGVPGAGRGEFVVAPADHRPRQPRPLGPQDVGHIEAVAGDHPGLGGSVSSAAARPGPRMAGPPALVGHSTDRRAAAYPVTGHRAAQSAGDHVEVLGRLGDPPTHRRRPRFGVVDRHHQRLSPLSR
jgi:hypothetical protein